MNVQGHTSARAYQHNSAKPMLHTALALPVAACRLAAINKAVHCNKLCITFSMPPIHTSRACCRCSSSPRCWWSSRPKHKRRSGCGTHTSYAFSPNTLSSYKLPLLLRLAALYQQVPLLVEQTPPERTQHQPSWSWYPASTPYAPHCPSSGSSLDPFRRVLTGCPRSGCCVQAYPRPKATSHVRQVCTHAQ